MSTTPNLPAALPGTNFTAREIYESPKAILSGVASQYRFIMRRYHDERHPCPSCNFAQSIVEAAGHTLDTYPWDKSDSEVQMRCRNPDCARPLMHILSMWGASSFRIDNSRNQGMRL